MEVSFSPCHPSADPDPSEKQQKINKVIEFFIESYPDLLSRKIFEQMCYMQPEAIRKMIKTKKYLKWLPENDDEFVVSNMDHHDVKLVHLIIKVHPELTWDDYISGYDSDADRYDPKKNEDNVTETV